MKAEIYTLPEITFIGGETQEILFRLKNPAGELHSIYNGAADFSFCPYTYKSGTPSVSIPPYFLDDGNGGTCKILVTIPASETVDRYGKFVYQLIIKEDSKIIVVCQGLMNIARNINKRYIYNGV